MNLLMGMALGTAAFSAAGGVGVTAPDIQWEDGATVDWEDGTTVEWES